MNYGPETYQATTAKAMPPALNPINEAISLIVEQRKRLEEITASLRINADQMFGSVPECAEAPTDRHGSESAIDRLGRAVMDVKWMIEQLKQQADRNCIFP